jgi:hypothetical protein
MDNGLRGKQNSVFCHTERLQANLQAIASLIVELPVILVLLILALHLHLSFSASIASYV